jgi:hypothetical protein
VQKPKVAGRKPVYLGKSAVARAEESHLPKRRQLHHTPGRDLLAGVVWDSASNQAKQLLFSKRGMGDLEKGSRPCAPDLVIRQLVLQK